MKIKLNFIMEIKSIPFLFIMNTNSNVILLNPNNIIICSCERPKFTNQYVINATDAIYRIAGSKTVIDKENDCLIGVFYDCLSEIDRNTYIESACKVNRVTGISAFGKMK